jgi:putative transposase
LFYLKIPDNAVNKTKFTEAQIVFALGQADTGVTVAEVCRKMGISEATYYNWKKKYGGLGVLKLRWFKQLKGRKSASQTARNGPKLGQVDARILYSALR